MVLNVYWIAFFTSVVLNLYVTGYVSVVIHEYGHYFFRKLFHVKTCVFIGYKKYLLKWGDWQFGYSFSPAIGGCNYPYTS